MFKSYKYRIMPSEDQKRQIEHHFGCCRLVWNLALETKIRAYQSNKTNLSRYDLQAQLIDLKLANEWLYDANAQSLLSVLMHLDKAYNNFFAHGGFPKFKNKYGKQSFQCPQSVYIDGNKIKLPKIGKVEIVLSRTFDGKIKTVTISKTPTGKYFASILVDTNSVIVSKTPVDPKTTIGIDTGIKDFVISSNGKKFLENRKLKNNLKRLKCLQRRVSRKKKGGKNRKKLSQRLAVLHEKITNQRLDYIHKVTHALTHDNQVRSIVIEDLNVSGLLKNRKLSQAMSDVSLGEFYRQLGYKCDWYGINLIKIGRFDPSSKRCSDCGEINGELTLSDRSWTCKCGSTHDRDENAAKNIKWFGLNNSGRGTSGEPAELLAIAEAKKQESLSQKIK